jgi:N-acetylmuramoyl-L-alanine amidase
MSLRLAGLVAVVVLAGGCVKHSISRPTSIEQAMKMLDHRPAWTRLGSIDVPRHPAEVYLNGMTIVLDPGHGGDAWKEHWKRGPTGVREAEINLRVGLLLGKLLRDAGAKAVLTRESDTDLDLDERAAMANSVVRADGGVGADLFISIHHNATSNRSVNYTTIWYHGSVDDNEPDLDPARYIAHAVGRHIRTQVAKTAPVLSSQLMYDGGFGVLRSCRVPAILCELSFFTDPAEEQRLRDASYNLREAYAIYEGLCEWAYCGRPQQAMPVVERDGARSVVRTTLNDGLPAWWGSDRNRIIQSTVCVELDGKRVPFVFDAKSKRLATTLPSEISAGEHVLAIHHANMFENHNWPQRYAVEVMREEQTVRAWVTEALGAVRPATTRPASRPTTQGGGRGRGRGAGTRPTTRRS